MPVDSLAYTEMGKKDLKGSLLNRPLVIPQTRQSIPTIKSGMELYHLEDHRMPQRARSDSTVRERSGILVASNERDYSNSPWFASFRSR